MSFLDDAKKKGTPVVPAAKPANPLSPFAKKTEVKIVTATPVTDITKKPMPFLKKTTEEVKPETTEVKKNPLAPKAVAPAPVKEEPIEEQEVPFEAPVETSVEEKKPVAAPAKKAPAKKASTTVKATETNEVKDEMSEMIEIPTTEVSYAEAMELITSKFVDAEWQAYETEVKTQIDAIVIESDMNCATLKAALSKISQVYDRIWYEYQQVKNQYDYVSQREPEGLIERLKKINIDGSNDYSRKKSGIVACMGYKHQGKTLNLFEILDESRKRYNFLKGSLDTLNFKRNVLITMNGALKIEDEG